MSCGEKIICFYCKTEFNNKKSMTNHRRWHNVEGYIPYQERMIKKCRDAKLGKKNPMWVGDKVGYDALHAWVRRHKPKLEFCECCGVNPPYDLANISQEYHRDINDFEWLCRNCHMGKDSRIFNLKNQKRGD